MIKTLAYYPIHYGAEYLEASIQSIFDNVDKIVILYTSKPSYGHSTNIACPETEEEIKQVAIKAAGEKLEWVNIHAQGEGSHRGQIWEYTSGYDVLLAVDADEVWEPSELTKAIQETYEGSAWRRNVSGFINFWKSFDYACYDSFVPARLFKISATNKDEQTINGKIYHFGYAQSDKIMNYKFEIHGHKNEIKPGWLQNTYFGWNTETRLLHPTSNGIWGEAIPFDKNTMPDCLKKHPNFNREIIS